MNTKTIIISSFTAALLASTASACDVCGADLPHLSLEDHSGWHFGAGEQYTSFGTLQQDGHRINDPAGQYLHSSITQLYLGHDFAHALGVQINVPLIDRRFRRVEDGEIQTGSVAGLGDVSLLAHWTPLIIERGDFAFTGRLVAGIKFPTGDSDRVREEAHEHGDGHEHGEGEEHGEEHEHEEGFSVPSGIHGHDLALGTGSVDGIFGVDMRFQWKRAFLETGVQGVVRGSGRHDYDYADDLIWYAGLGAVVFQNDDLTIGLEAHFSGDTKGEDTFRGVRAEDTSSTVIYVGPKARATWRDRVSVDMGFAFPIVRENSGTASMPDVRFQSSVNIRF